MKQFEVGQRTTCQFGSKCDIRWKADKHAFVLVEIIAIKKHFAVPVYLVRRVGSEETASAMATTTDYFAGELFCEELLN